MIMSLYLIPTSLGETRLENILPQYNFQIIAELRFFVVENVRTARRFLKEVNRDINIDELTFFTLNEHTAESEKAAMLKPLLDGNDMGIISEAGCPAIADPGAEIVALAQKANIKIVPLVGPSSIFLALMASGFNGQNFAFSGYLPIDAKERTKKLKTLENRAYNENQSQIFIETPYRNNKMLSDIVTSCNSETKLCIAADITLETEFIKTKKVAEWKRALPDLNKRPCIFIIYK
ncbi:MAG: SAM-dependent methyltransferase [Paludibacter sp.]|nr:SAM-dependent methyltransferase [Paludibacter sp.]